MYGIESLFQALRYQAFVDFGYLMLLVYFIAMSAVTIYALFQFHLLFLYKKFHKENPKPQLKQYNTDEQNVPFVTVQLPMYNEMYVAERIIDFAAAQEYPKDRFEIHVLDDSTDETKDIVARKVAALQAEGYNIRHIHRVNRQGYKAGALQDAMPYANGDFIAIFDADFTPRPNFLRSTMIHFEDPKVGIVQSRWEHINADYSLLTKLQAMLLNVHFTVEQGGRSYGNLLLQFNGTAGVWRKKVIEEAGGWQSDTLTEDLDLSFRAQIMGYSIKYLEKLGSPAELPVEMNGLKGQQFRWNKGGAQNARKLLKMVWQTEKLNWTQKVHAMSQLVAYGVFMWLFIAAVSSIPLSFAFSELGISTHFLSFSILGLFAVATISYTANVTAALDREAPPTFREKLEFFAMFITALPISMGLSLYNTIAVVEGLMGKASSFVRTPKYGITGKQGSSFKKAAYVARKISWVTIAEGLMALIFFIAVIVGISTGNYAFVLFHSMMGFGFSFICYYSIKHLRMR